MPGAVVRRCPEFALPFSHKYELPTKTTYEWLSGGLIVDEWSISTKLKGVNYV